MRRLRFAALIILLIGCGGGGSFWVVVEFPTGYQDEASTTNITRHIEKTAEVEE